MRNRLFQFSLVLCVVQLSTASRTLAQGTITDGAADFAYNAGAFDASPSGNFRVPSPTDHLFEQGWFFRIAGDGQEFFFLVPDTQDYTGNVETLDWNDVNARSFSARAVVTLKAGGPMSARVQIDLTVTNNTGAEFVIHLFHMVDMDLQPTAGNDSATLFSPNNYISITTGGSANTAEYRGFGADAFLVRPFGGTDLGNVLGDASADDLDNSGLPFGPGDFTAGLQWTRTVASGASTTVSVVIAINEPANSLTEACCLPDFSCAVLSEPNCEAMSGFYTADTTCDDTDGDGRADVCDACPADANKFSPGVCGCGVADTDSDADGTLDCNDECPNDPAKTAAGGCGCGVADTDANGNGTADCLEVPAGQTGGNGLAMCGVCGAGTPLMCSLAPAFLVLWRRRLVKRRGR